MKPTSEASRARRLACRNQNAGVVRKDAGCGGCRAGRPDSRPRVHSVWMPRRSRGAIRENVDRTSRIVTDEWKAYPVIGKEFAGGHERVNHGKSEYARGDIHTNTA